MEFNINLKNLIYIITWLLYSILGLKIKADEDNSKDIKWEIIRSINHKNLNKSLEWEIYNENNVNTKKDIIIKNEISNSSKKPLQLAKSVPTGNTLSKGIL